MLSRLIGVLALLAAVAGTSNAGSFQVNPVRATLSVSQKVSALTVRNTGSEAAVIQMEIAAWSQQNGEDIYLSTRDLLATPPIFTVPAGGSQIVRVGLRRAPDPARELTYRLFLQEVPPPPKPGFQGLQVALRIGVPVFVVPAEEPRQDLVWNLHRTPEGKIEVSLANQGNVHIQVANFRLLGADGADLGTQHIASYVLPGQSRHWQAKNIPVPAAAARLHLFAQTDAGDMDAGLLSVEPK